MAIRPCVPERNHGATLSSAPSSCRRCRWCRAGRGHLHGGLDGVRCRDRAGRSRARLRELDRTQPCRRRRRDRHDHPDGTRPSPGGEPGHDRRCDERGRADHRRRGSCRAPSPSHPQPNSPLARECAPSGTPSPITRERSLPSPSTTPGVPWSVGGPPSPCRRCPGWIPRCWRAPGCASPRIRPPWWRGTQPTWCAVRQLVRQPG